MGEVVGEEVVASGFGLPVPGPDPSASVGVPSPIARGGNFLMSLEAMPVKVNVGGRGSAGAAGVLGKGCMVGERGA